MVAMFLPPPDDDEEEEEEDDDCMDLHPRCQEWADEGECAANPKYMIGHGSVRGYCRKSCGLCQPASVARKPGEGRKHHHHRHYPDSIHPETSTLTSPWGLLCGGCMCGCTGPCLPQ